jgi:Phage tail tube protein, GTA-gp10
MTEQLHECARRLTWAGGTHVFNLADDFVLKVMAGALCPMPTALLLRGDYMNKGCFAGQFGDTPSAAMKRFNEGVYSLQDVEHIIELGLIGGGDVTVAEAVDLVDEHVRGRAIGPSAQLAFEIIAALFVGVTTPVN